MNNQLNKTFCTVNVTMQISTLSFPITVLFPNVLNHQIISQCFREFSSSLSVPYQLCVNIVAHDVSKVTTAF